ncbi:hypothetical protein DV736_g5281, partial [Chaetothyriales sp. CBS 134916]
MASSQSEAPAAQPNATAKTFEPHRNSKYDPKKVHISETPMTRSNWWKHVNWLNVVLIIGVPLYGCIQALWVPLQLKTAIWAVLYYFATGVGITAGYHRLWAHTSYSATIPLRIFLAAVGGGAVEGSIRWWARDHRAHHRYTDTDKDPYSVRKGLIYSHFGWMLLKQNPKRIGRTDISDLNEDPVVIWQHRNYLKVVIAMGLIFPTLVAGLGWNDWWGGFIYAGILRIFFVQQATFCVNSLAHWLGDQPFDDRNSPRDHVVTALVTLGEGYHNFHHEFPSDYRNAIEWFQYDPTKWSIWVWKQLGLAYDLKQFRNNEIEKGRVQQLQKKLDQKRARLDWGVPLDQLPVLDWEEYVEQANNGRALIAIAGVVHDVAEFIKDHPGGKAMIKSGIGKDATAMFNGGVYMHSNAAHNLLSTMRVGVIRGGCEVEIWKRSQMEAKGEIARDSSGDRIVRAGLQPTKVLQNVPTAVLILLPSTRTIYLTPPAFLFLGIRIIDAVLIHAEFRPNACQKQVFKARNTSLVPDENGVLDQFDSCAQKVAILLLGAKSNHPFSIFAPQFVEMGDWFGKMSKQFYSDLRRNIAAMSTMCEEAYSTAAFADHTTPTTNGRSTSEPGGHGCELVSPHQPDILPYTPPASLGPSFSLREIELIHHYCTRTYITLNSRITTHVIFRDTIFKESLRHEFLLHAIMGTSALHKAVMLPCSSEDFEEYAKVALTHQNAALAGYIPAVSRPSEQNGIALFSLSLLLTVWAFATKDLPENLKKAGMALTSLSGDPDVLLPIGSPTLQFVEIIMILRGIYSVMKETDQWLQGDIEELLRYPQVHELPSHPLEVEKAYDLLDQELRAFNSDDVEAKELCIEQISRLREISRCRSVVEWDGHIFSFFVMAPPSFINLIKRGNPMALVIFAYWSACFRCMDHHWWANGWSQTLVHDVSRLIDMNAWAKAMGWPKLQCGFHST